jgi:hypothetical protein
VVVLITAVQIHFNSCCHRHTILAVFIIAVIILAVIILPFNYCHCWCRCHHRRRCNLIIVVADIAVADDAAMAGDDSNKKWR